MGDYERVAQVLRYLDEHREEQPGPAELAQTLGLSPHNFRRLFLRWAGATPDAFLRCLSTRHARALLTSELSEPSPRLELRLETSGAGWSLRAGFAETPFGLARLAEGARGLCELAFVDARDRAAGAQALHTLWPGAELVWEEARARELAREVFDGGAEHARAPVRACVRASRFQLQVWRALLRIPAGTVTSYGRLAEAVGRPGAARAVGTAVGSNTLAYLIPCHRVIRETGAVGGYRWGEQRKRALLAWESAPRRLGELRVVNDREEARGA